MKKLYMSSNPHVTSSNSTRRIMLDVLIALLPCVIASILLFGARPLAIYAICIVTCAVSELLFTLIKNKTWTWKAIKKSSITDLSCVVTGVILACNVPHTIPLWMPAIGSVFAIVIVKMMFGGIGKNFANPAMVGRLFMFVSFMSAMTAVATTSGNIIGLDASSSATWLGNRNPSEIATNFWAMFLGNKSTCAMGEVSILAILIGYAYLVVRHVIDWKLPLYIIGGVALFSLFFDGLINQTGANIFYTVVGHLMSGGLMFGAVFMATDYATSPNTKLGNLIYGLGIALLVSLIRIFGSYPEGMSFAIVLMNIIVPQLDKYIVPKPFGYVNKHKEAK